MGKYLDDPLTAWFRHLQRFQQLEAAHPGPEPCDQATRLALSKQAAEELAQEDRDAVYYPPESPRGRDLCDAVLSIQELMAEIFTHCLPIMPEDRFSEPAPHRAPLLVTQVCRRWRRVALSTPTLWNSFPLESSFNLPLFRLWMERSGASPLSFSADDASLESILPYSHRWRSISLKLNDSSVPALTAVRDRVPYLRRLQIKFNDDNMEFFEVERILSSCDAFQNAPSLRSVCITAPPPDFELPFFQLHSLAIYKVSADYLVRVCYAASNLTSLHIAMDGMTSHYSDLPSCTLVHLKYLWAYDCSIPSFTDSAPVEFIKPPCRIAALLAKFTCPALREVDIGTIPEVSESDTSSIKKGLLSFLSCSPLITQLILGVRLNYDDILLDIFRHVPALEKTEIIHLGVWSADFFEHLTYDPDAPALPLCPRLRVFDGGQHRPIESAPALVNMIASRWRVADDGPVARLQSITLNCDDAQFAEQLADFAKEGLALHLKKEKFEFYQPKKSKKIENVSSDESGGSDESRESEESEATGCTSQ
ncbi:hypothetical protein C8R47DRAFT_1110656 [Mycena vitilis]|nr:hypothetical protein C8R47DRAFT_1110656 [Mycena vitilis]